MNGLVGMFGCFDSSLTCLFRFVLAVLAGQAFIQVRTHADTLPIQQSQSAAVVTRLTLAHVVLGRVVCCGPLQVGYPGVGVRHIQWN